MVWSAPYDMILRARTRFYLDYPVHMKVQIPAFESARVLVVGDVMLDRYWYGTASRISPEAPVPVVRVEQVEERPGGAGNVAQNVAALGAGATVIGITGEDEAAENLSQHLSKSGVECLFLRSPSCSTITKLRVLSQHQQLIRLDFEEPFQEFDFTLLIETFTKCLPGFDVVVFSDYGKGTLRPIKKLIDMACNMNKPVLVDPKSRDFSVYQGATVITPNLSELAAVVGPCKDEDELWERGRSLIHSHGFEAILVTRGEQGMTLLRKKEGALHLPAQAREVYDVTGAGDTVISVLAAGLAAGQNIAQATALANLAAGIVVGKLGTATVSAPELRHALHEQDASAHGTMTEKQLLVAAHDARARGETIVMTNGCFDLLHAGHVAYLKQARALGDRLIVAVNDDVSVRRLKGDGRPINLLEQRLSVLASLECVDWVVPFSEDTPERLICRVLPDYLVKGGDYRPDQVCVVHARILSLIWKQYNF